jgi:hypothetical protein
MEGDGKLTGKVRYQLWTGWFHKPRLVVQVEVHFQGMDLVGGFPEHTEYNYWRDARAADFIPTFHLTPTESV